jgi:hypothetical protein
VLLFHGTTKRLWREKYKGPSTLYMASTVDNALQYAWEASESEEANGHRRPQPIVLAVNVGDLKGLERLPDDAVIRSRQLPATATWRDSMRAVGSMAVYGLIDKYKKFFKVVLVPKTVWPT